MKNNDSDILIKQKHITAPGLNKCDEYLVSDILT